MAIAFVISVMQVMALMGMPSESRQIVQTLFTWISSGDFTLDLALRLDALSAVMILVITGIGSLIHLYSTSYMHEETDAEYARRSEERRVGKEWRSWRSSRRWNNKRWRRRCPRLDRRSTTDRTMY